MDARKLGLGAAVGAFRCAFTLRRLASSLRRPSEHTATPAMRAAPATDAAALAGQRPRRSILLVTSDQQRYDALGVNGGGVARTPTLDALASAGINYQRAHVQAVTCMPARSTMLTGQHPRTHGVLSNGIPLPDDAPSVAELLRGAGYRTALIGKAHFDPHLDPTLHHFENRCAAERRTGPWHGFEHIELATHGPVGGHHYADWMWREHREHIGGFGGVLSGSPGGDSGAPEVTFNPVPRDCYHTDWVAARARAWLDRLDPDEPFFLWVSFPDPHHPFDPPLTEVRDRVGDFRDLALPPGYPGDVERAAALLADRPRHWRDWIEGRFRNPEGGPVTFKPGRLTADQVREVNAMVHVENELIDEACGALLGDLARLGRDDDTDVFYTSDHGELQGDLGLLFKGPYHVDALMRIPLIWRPAPVAAVTPARVPEPVGHVDLAPTFCQVAEIEVPSWMEGSALPSAAGSDRRAVITTFDSQFAAVGMHLRTVFCDGHICTSYAPSTRDVGGRFPLKELVWLRGSRIPRYDGSEGELYDCAEDPHQWRNRWSDPAKRALRDDLVALLRELLPPLRQPPLPVTAPT